MNIIARKPKPSNFADNVEYIVVDRGDGQHMRYVSASATPETLAHGEWFWGYYFQTVEEALAHFNGR